MLTKRCTPIPPAKELGKSGMNHGLIIAHSFVFFLLLCLRWKLILQVLLYCLSTCMLHCNIITISFSWAKVRLLSVLVIYNRRKWEPLAGDSEAARLSGFSGNVRDFFDLLKAGGGGENWLLGNLHTKPWVWGYLSEGICLRVGGPAGV